MISSVNVLININVNTNTLFKSKNKKIRIPFTPDEDEKIKLLVKRFGTKQWRLISSLIDGRSPKQCRERYSNYLACEFFKGEWSKTEDDLLVKLYLEIGPKWSILQKSFPDRSVTAVKNRWRYFLCRQIDHDQKIENKAIVNEKTDNNNDKKDQNVANSSNQLSKCNNDYQIENKMFDNAPLKKTEEKNTECDQNNNLLEFLNDNFLINSLDWSMFI